jgi:hypothetical protein
MGTSEARQGQIVDTTAETLADYSRRAAELDEFIAKHEGHDAKRS